MVVRDEGDTDRERVVYEGDDFWVSTTNKQLNFVQHVKSLLDADSLPDPDVIADEIAED